MIDFPDNLTRNGALKHGEGIQKEQFLNQTSAPGTSDFFVPQYHQVDIPVTTKTHPRIGSRTPGPLTGDALSVVLTESVPESRSLKSFCHGIRAIFCLRVPDNSTSLYPTVYFRLCLCDRSNVF